jgi:hypothetical protein
MCCLHQREIEGCTLGQKGGLRVEGGTVTDRLLSGVGCQPLGHLRLRQHYHRWTPLPSQGTTTVSTGTLLSADLRSVQTRPLVEGATVCQACDIVH